MKIDRNQIALFIALVATILLGRMSWTAHAGAFENPEPTLFEQLEILWRTLYWAVPAILIGAVCSRHILISAAAVKFLASSILLSLEYPNLTNDGTAVPDPASLLFSMATDVLSGIPLAIVLAWVIAITAKKLDMRKSLLVMALLPAGVGLAWATPTNFSQKALLAQWSQSKAAVDAAHDIAAGSMKIYIHGTIAGYAVGIDRSQLFLTENLPTAEAGVGCVIGDMEVFTAQGEYASRYNKAIVEYLERRSHNRQL